MDMAQLRELGLGAMLHDIGKLCIPREILKKPSQLTVEEFEEIKKHTVLGYELLKKSGQLYLVSAYIALGHHERYDGSGYPLRLKNEEIQMYSRIVAVADVYDSLTSDRVYRKKLKSQRSMTISLPWGSTILILWSLRTLSNSSPYIRWLRRACSIRGACHRSAA